MRKKLVEYLKDKIWRGAILECTNNDNELVQYMVCETREINCIACQIIVLTGYYAGYVEQVLPNDSCPNGCQYAIDVNWLKENWGNLFWGDVNDVWIIDEN